MQTSGRSAWQAVQAIMLAGGVVLWGSLWFAPETGLAILWNAVIPAAPAVFVIAAGWWRNICPLATLSLLPQRLLPSLRPRLSLRCQAKLQLAGVLLLLLIVPLRRVSLDLSGPATAITLGAVALLAVAAGLVGEKKSAWCAGLCPVLPVESLYGTRPVRTFPNTRCGSCQACVARCPDSMKRKVAAESRPPFAKLAAILMTGGFPGFIAGWMQVPDYRPDEGWNHALEAWGLPAVGMVLSLTLYGVLRRLMAARHHSLLAALFAAASVIIYYWFRLPGLMGFPGPAGTDGVLVDIHDSIPHWTPAVLRAGAVGFFLFWFLRVAPDRQWMYRPSAQGGVEH